MNVAQRIAYNARVAAAKECGHVVRIEDTPLERKAVCSCRWRHVVHRKGRNAQGTSAKLKAAIQVHLRDVIEKSK